MAYHKGLLSLVLFILFLLAGVISQATETLWKAYAKNDPVIEYYDPGSLTYPVKGVVRLKLKMACVDERKCSEFRKQLVQGTPGQTRPDYEKWAYTLKSVDLRCADRKVRFLSVTNVDENGKIIDSSSLEKSYTWQDLKNPWNVPDPMENLFEIVCK